MTSKIIIAKLKEPVTVATRVKLEFDQDWLAGSIIIEQTKKNLLHKLKEEMHTKIAIMDVDDILFQVQNT